MQAQVTVVSGPEPVPSAAGVGGILRPVVVAEWPAEVEAGGVRELEAVTGSAECKKFLRGRRRKPKHVE